MASVFFVETAPLAHGVNLRFRINLLQLSRHMTCKSRKNRSHIKLALASQNLFLQSFLLHQPIFRKRTLPIIHIRHTVPRQLSRAGKISANFFVRQSHLCPYFIPNRLLPRNSQRHSHPVQSHPVDQTFPILPLPIGHCITKRTIVQEETIVACSLTTHCLIKHRKFFWHHNAVGSIPRHMCMAVILQIVIQSHSHGIVIVSLNMNLTRLRGQRKMIGL